MRTAGVVLTPPSDRVATSRTPPTVGIEVAAEDIDIDGWARQYVAHLLQINHTSLST